jgi:hypothetical protein
MLPPDPLTDEQVLETFQSMNDVIRMRMLTSEVLPSPIQTYRIGKVKSTSYKMSLALFFLIQS